MATVQSYHPQIDIDLCYLLDKISLSGQDSVRRFNVPPTPSTDVDMSVSAQPVPTQSKQHTDEEQYGCGLLQAVQAQVEACQTTGGEYLDIIFTHRELLFAYPAAHRTCSRGFTDLARQLEQRAWRADREGDSEAVVAFRNEAWIIAERWRMS
ncbi:hypothetical protein OE88DRAFT_1660165 [Heliocybe sulcata]|uniref:Uncharacterized protein n=1 Tax=Heliocybe sulcata TaxID=5364 RepID=A0A5C3N118_9AGAM|nr:hypothetical protein OE88DRAFT_1660165 [Heliocybe sulcata]